MDIVRHCGSRLAHSGALGMLLQPCLSHAPDPPLNPAGSPATCASTAAPFVCQWAADCPVAHAVHSRDSETDQHASAAQCRSIAWDYSSSGFQLASEPPNTGNLKPGPTRLRVGAWSESETRANFQCIISLAAATQAGIVLVASIFTALLSSCIILLTKVECI